MTRHRAALIALSSTPHATPHAASHVASHVVALIFLTFLSLAATVPAFAATCDELWTIAATVTWSDPQGMFGSDYERCAELRWGQRWASNGCMHPTDHQSAWRVVYGREPSLIEVEDSWRSGCAIVWRSRCLTMKRDTIGRPLDWAAIFPGARMLEVLMYLAELRTGSCEASVSLGMKIFDGKSKDPEPEKTATVFALWTGAAPPPSPLPEKPTVCPAGQSCQPPCPECPPIGLTGPPSGCSRWTAVVAGASAIRTNLFSAAHRRRLVDDCIQALNRAWFPSMTTTDPGE